MKDAVMMITTMKAIENAFVTEKKKTKIKYSLQIHEIAWAHVFDPSRLWAYLEGALVVVDNRRSAVLEWAGIGLVQYPPFVDEHRNMSLEEGLEAHRYNTAAEAVGIADKVEEDQPSILYR